MAKTFVFNDETVKNNHGFILLNAGGKLDRFIQNPVMLYNHDSNILAGKWENLRTDGTKLVADPIFDDGDEVAKGIQGKVDRGFLNGASMGIQIQSAELRSIPGMDLVPVVTEWELLEGSVVPVPSNAMCLKLYSPSGKLLLTDDEIKLSIDSIITNKHETKMEKVILTAEAATALGIAKDPEATALDAAILALAKKATAAESALSAFHKERANALVDLAIAEGRMTADKKESFVTLATNDFKQASDLISSMPVKTTLVTKIKLSGGSEEQGRQDWDYMRWAKEDPHGLALLKAEKPTEFDALKVAYKPKH